MKNKRISVRADEDAFTKIHQKAKTTNLTLSDYVIRACLDKKIVVIDGLDEVVRQQKAIGNNLNQLAALAHMGQIRTVKLAELQSEYAKLNEYVSSILARKR